MDKTELEEVFHIEKEISGLKERIEKKSKQSHMAGDVVQNGYKRKAVIYGVDIIRQEKIDKLYIKLEMFNNKLQKKKEEIEDYIEKIPFSELRQIFRYRYLDGKDYKQVATEMNKKYKTYKYTDDNVRKKHDRFFEKN